jgi:hypothetical protein
VLVALAVLVVIGVVFALQAVRAGSALRQAADQAQVLQDQVVAGDDLGARATLRGLRDSTSTAKQATDGAIWDVGTRIPFLGRNVAAVQTVSVVLDDVASQALPPIVDVSQKVDVNTFSPRGGKVDLVSIRRLRPAIAAADEALSSARSQLRAIDADSLLGPLRGPVSSVKDNIDSAQSAASSADIAAQLMPVMLGQDEKRSYLLMIQNNAEIRATGGIAGAFAIVSARQGKLSMGRQGSIQDLLPFKSPVTAMTADEMTVFTDQLVTDLRDVNVTPDFPRTGEITRAMVSKGLGVDVDGVISVDPVALSHILAGTGPVVLDDGTTIDENNVVQTLLNTVYLTIADAAAQDDVFASAARTIFDVVKAGSSPPRPIIAGMARAADENRLMVWSAHPEEQAALRPTGLSGAFAGDAGTTPHVGIYFGDGAASKMEYYLEYSSSVVATRCLSGGVQEITTTTDVTSNAPPGLPITVTGPESSVARGDMRLFAWLYTPFGGRFSDISIDGEKQVINDATLNGRAETTVGFTLQPGQSRIITTTMTSGSGQTGNGVFSTTPGVQPTPNDTTIESACG